MPLGIVGLSHHTAPLDVRERLVFGATETADVLSGLIASGAAAEAVLLSTCNRTEIYARFAEAGASTDEVAAALAQRAGVSRDVVDPYLYRLRGREAAAHLLRVASSLDSMVLGEAQIQGQVREAYERAAALRDDGARAVGPVLARLFEIALRVGGRVRTETALGTGAASVPSAAVELARKIFGSLAGRRALVIGSGDMSELALQCFAAEGVRNAIVVGRTEERAHEVASRTGAEAFGFEDIEELLPQVDLIATATAAPHHVLTREMLARALPGGPKRPLLIVDIALPRDVEPRVAEIDNVFLYNLDDLRQIVDTTLERRRAEVEAAARIVDEGVAEFWGWYRSLEVVPVIRALRDRAEEVRRSELEKTLRRLNHLAPEDREAVDALTRQLLAKVLHQPTVRLREAASNGRGGPVADAARYLFELERATEPEEE